MNKQAIAETFGHAAKTYDASAHLQRHVADELLHYTYGLPDVQFEHVADLGAGTGYLSCDIASKHPNVNMTALDLSAEMLALTKQKLPSLTTVVGDLEKPEFLPESLDLAVSSLAVQWLDAPLPFLKNILNCLKPGGYLALSTLGPKTLWELKAAWQMVDSITHVNRFLPGVDWIEASVDSGFEIPLWREERVEVSYGQPIQLLTELKALGANHVDRDKAPTGTGLRKMLSNYRHFKRDDGEYPATWDVYYLILRKPIHSTST